MGLARFPISDYRGGLNLRDGPFALESNECQSCKNVSISDRGVLYRRAGTVTFDGGTAIAIGKKAENLKHAHMGTTGRLMASVDGTIYNITSAGTVSSSFAGTAGTVWAFEPMTDVTNAQYMWCMNGTDVPKKISSAYGISNWGGGPPTGSMCRVWKNRMVVSGVAAFPQRVYYSPVGDPENALLATTFIDIRTSDDDDDPITALELVGDYLLVFKSSSCYVITDSTTFSFRRLGPVGCSARFQTAVLRGRAYFISRIGVWSTDGLRPPRLESAKIQPMWLQNIDPAFVGVNNPVLISLNLLSTARLVAWQNRIYMSFSSTVPTRYVLEFIPQLDPVEGSTDPSGGAWFLHKFHEKVPAQEGPFGMCEYIDPTTLVPRLVGGFITLVANTPFTFSMMQYGIVNDNGSTIASLWLSGWRPIQSQEPFERLRRINIELVGNMILDVFKDLALAPSAFTQAFAVAAPTPALVRARPEVRGRYHCVRFSHGVLNQTFSVYAAEIVYRGGKEHT